MGVIKSAIGDMLMTFSWVVLSATFGLQTTEIISAAGLHGITWAPLAITTFLIFVYVSLFTVVFGSASFNPTGNAAFYAAGIPGDTLFTLAIRLPAQVCNLNLKIQTFFSKVLDFEVLNLNFRLCFVCTNLNLSCV
ncbi:hypothetical protein Bca52824_095821 [Brassica carinata]|uniref:Uncharacterized protein n=1 Tax=Brassica carinata TaxID=52824 RepID=A0A8X7P2P0_BRACI|nr:hypothetical protein Bca52824_095821 [Brassica carinata]